MDQHFTPFCQNAAKYHKEEDFGQQVLYPIDHIIPSPHAGDPGDPATYSPSPVPVPSSSKPYSATDLEELAYDPYDLFLAEFDDSCKDLGGADAVVDNDINMMSMNVAYLEGLDLDSMFATDVNSAQQANVFPGIGQPSVIYRDPEALELLRLLANPPMPVMGNAGPGTRAATQSMQMNTDMFRANPSGMNVQAAAPSPQSAHPIKREGSVLSQTSHRSSGSFPETPIKREQASNTPPPTLPAASYGGAPYIKRQNSNTTAPPAFSATVQPYGMQLLNGATPRPHHFQATNVQASLGQLPYVPMMPHGYAHPANILLPPQQQAQVSAVPPQIMYARQAHIQQSVMLPHAYPPYPMLQPHNMQYVVTPGRPPAYASYVPRAQPASTSNIQWRPIKEPKKVPRKKKVIFKPPTQQDAFLAIVERIIRNPPDQALKIVDEGLDVLAVKILELGISEQELADLEEEEAQRFEAVRRRQEEIHNREEDQEDKIISEGTFEEKENVFAEEQGDGQVEVAGSSTQYAAYTGHEFSPNVEPKTEDQFTPEGEEPALDMSIFGDLGSLDGLFVIDG